VSRHQVPGTNDIAKGRLADQLLAVVEAEHLGGCPVAGRDDVARRETVAIAMRRWRSFARRSARRGQATHPDRVEDLAKGLRDHFEVRPALAGPLMEDYRHLAARLAAIFADSPAE
jgi:hypothetical protein